MTKFATGNMFRILGQLRSVILAAPLVAGVSFAADGTFRTADMVAGIRPDGRGIALATHGAHALVTVARTLKITKAAEQAYEFGDGVMQSLDLDKLLDSPLAKVLPDGRRVFGLTGAMAKGAYVIDYLAAPIEALKAPSFLAFGSTFTAAVERQPIKDVSRGFILGGQLKAHTGEWSHHSVQRLMGGALHMLSPENLTRLPPAAADSGKDPHSLGNNVLADVRRTFPQSLALAERYLEFQPAFTIVGTGAEALTRIDDGGILNIDRLIADYPDLGDYIRVLADRFELDAQVAFVLPSGLALYTSSIDSYRRIVKMTAYTKGGRLIPMDQNGKPHPEQAFDPATVTEQNGELRVKVTCNVLGLHIKVKDIRIATTFKDGPRALITARLSKISTPEITGAALGVFPEWAINLAIPGSIEEYSKLFIDGLLRGPRGQGSGGTLMIDTQTPGATQLNGSGQAELVDNFFINLGLRFAQSYVWPSKAVLTDSWKLAVKSAMATEQDLSRLNQVAH